MQVLVVRHAHAVSRSRWEGDDVDRVLSGKGRRQSARLVGVLEEFKPARILSSPARRCIDTVAPLAAALGSEVEVDGRLAEGTGGAALGLVRELSGGAVVVCSHGDVIPDILLGLADEDRLDLGRSPKVEKASVWVLDRAGGRFTAATYLPPAD